MLLGSLCQEDPPGEGNSNPIQYSFLGNPVDRGTWQAAGHGVAKELDMIKGLNIHFNEFYRLPSVNYLPKAPVIHLPAPLSR